MLIKKKKFNAVVTTKDVLPKRYNMLCAYYLVTGLFQLRGGGTEPSIYIKKKFKSKYNVKKCD